MSAHIYIHINQHIGIQIRIINTAFDGFIQNNKKTKTKHKIIICIMNNKTFKNYHNNFRIRFFFLQNRIKLHHYSQFKQKIHIAKK